MKTLKIDLDTDDLSFDGQNSFEMVSGNDEQKQSINRLLTTNVGEYFINTLLGLDYKYLQVKNPDLSRIRAELTKALNQEPRIQRINSIELDYNQANRSLSIDFNITMNETEITGNEVIAI